MISPLSMTPSLDVFAANRGEHRWLGSSETLEDAFELIRGTGPGSYLVSSLDTGGRAFYVVGSDGVVHRALGQCEHPN